jgi:predicted DNA-binding WGR domain protein
MEYTFIGWNRDEETNTDKVWGIIRLNGDRWEGNYVSFWGRRGKKLNTKTYESIPYWQVNKLTDEKIKKGYLEIDQEKLDSVYPDFKSDLEQTAFWASLGI